MATSQVGGLPLFSDTSATEVTESTASGILKAVSGVVTGISLAGNDATKFLNEQGAFAVPAGGGGSGLASVALGVIEPFPAYLFGTAAVAVLNAAFFYKFRVEADVTVSTIQVEVGTAVPTGNIDVGIYDSADAGVTLTRLRSSGSTAISASAGVKAIALSASLALVTGKDYWMALAVDNATDTLNRYAGRAPLMFAQKRAMTKTSSFPLPSSATTFASTNALYYVGAY